MASVGVQGIVVKVHPAGDCDPHTQLVGDCLVLVYPHPGHLLQHSLPAKCVQPVDLQLRVPDILQSFWGLVYLLRLHN